MAITDIVKIPIEANIDLVKSIAPSVQALKTYLTKELSNKLLQAADIGKNIRPTIEGGTREIVLPSGQRVAVTQSARSNISSMALRAKMIESIEKGENFNVQDFERYLQHVLTIKELPQKAIEPYKADIQRLNILKNSLKGMTKSEQIQTLQAYISKFGDFNKELSAKQKKIEKSLGGEAYASLRAKLAGMMTPEEQLAEILPNLAAGGRSVFSPTQRARLQATTNKLQATIKRNKITSIRDRFGNFMETVKGIEDFTKQEQILDRFLAQRGRLTDPARENYREFEEQMRQAQILRTNVERRRKQQEMYNRKRGFAQTANTVLMGSSLFLGAFGSAGFPALNVGFAAISASSLGIPVIGAVVAGTITAIGELSRKIMELRDSAVSVAQGIGFVSRQFKLMGAREQGIEAVIGGVAMSSDVAASKIREHMGLGGPSFFGGGLAKKWQDYTNAFSTQWRMFTGHMSGSRVDPRGITGILSPFTFWKLWSDQANRSSQEIPIELRSARHNLFQQLNKPTVGIENDPLAIWRRMQQAAFDPTKTEEMKIQKELISIIDKWIKTVEKQLEPPKAKGILESMLLLGGS